MRERERLREKGEVQEIAGREIYSPVNLHFTSVQRCPA